MYAIQPPYTGGGTMRVRCMAVCGAVYSGIHLSSYKVPYTYIETCRDVCPPWDLARRLTMADDVPAFLKEHGLESFVTAFADEGYDSVTVLRELDRPEFDKLVEVTGMKPGHAAKLRRALGVAPAPAPAPAPAEAPKKAAGAAGAAGAVPAAPPAEAEQRDPPQRPPAPPQLQVDFKQKILETKGGSFVQGNPLRASAASIPRERTRRAIAANAPAKLGGGAPCCMAPPLYRRIHSSAYSGSYSHGALYTAIHLTRIVPPPLQDPYIHTADTPYRHTAHTPYSPIHAPSAACGHLSTITS